MLTLAAWRDLASYIVLDAMARASLVLCVVVLCLASFCAATTLPNTADGRRALAEELRAAERAEAEALDNVTRKQIHRIATNLSEVYMDEAAELVMDAIKRGDTLMPHPLPVATSALPMLRESFPDSYGIYIETPEDLTATIQANECVPPYVKSCIERTGNADDDDDDYWFYSGSPICEPYRACIPTLKCSVLSDDLATFVRAIHEVSGYHPKLDDPVVLFTVYWDRDEIEFLKRRMDTWERDGYDRCKDFGKCSYYNGAPINKVVHPESPPPHPKTVQ